MSGRRGVAEGVQQVFAQNNPTQFNEETRIEVAQDSRGRHVLEVTEQGEEPVQTEVPDLNLKFWKGPIEGSIPELITVGTEIEGPNFELDASYSYVKWGREKEGDASIALSDLGIGVTSGGDVLGVLWDAIKGNLDEDSLVKFVSSTPNETLELAIDDIPTEYGEGNPDFLEHGGKSVGIDFDILGGEGTIQIVLIDDETGEEEMFEFDTEVEVEAGAGRGRAGVTETEIRDYAEASMGDDLTFENVEIRTTGDLEIAVTGIDFSTGYVENFLLFV